MRIRTVDFVGAVATPGGPKPADLPEIAFAGRSNVGKSTLINRLLGRTRTPVARVSNTPGKTREINFFRVDALPGGGGDPIEFHLVDLPGYGYARVPGALKDAWKPLMEDYLGRSTELRGVLQLIDVRRDPSPEDLQMLEFLAAQATPTLVVLTKIDKLKRTHREKQIRSIAERLELDMEQIVPFSSVTGEGLELLHAALEALLEPADA